MDDVKSVEADHTFDSNYYILLSTINQMYSLPTSNNPYPPCPSQSHFLHLVSSKNSDLTSYEPVINLFENPTLVPNLLLSQQSFPSSLTLDKPSKYCYKHCHIYIVHVHLLWIYFHCYLFYFFPNYFPSKKSWISFLSHLWSDSLSGNCTKLLFRSLTSFHILSLLWSYKWLSLISSVDTLSTYLPHHPLTFSIFFNLLSSSHTLFT